MSEKEEEALAAPCGLYCGACAIRRGDFRRASMRLLNLIRVYPGVGRRVSAVDPQLEGALEWLAEEVGPCGGCMVAAERLQRCQIRRCCLDERGLRFCHECGEFPCERLQRVEGHYGFCIDNLRAIQKEGLENWLRDQRRRVDAGFTYAYIRRP